MNKKRHILLILSSLLLLVASCRKSDYRASTLIKADDVKNINILFTSLRTSPQYFTVTAGVYSEFRATQGTRLRFYPHSFKDKTGNIIKSGNVQVGITEMYGAGAALANWSASLSGNQLLNNTGQAYVTASMNGNEIGVTKYGIDFLSLVNSGMPMGLYYGVTDYSDSLVRWMRVGNTVGTAVAGTVFDTMSVYLIDTMGTGVDTMHVYRSYNQFDSCGALHWVSSQYPAAITTGLTNLSVIPIDSSFDNSNTAVFVAFPDYNAIVPVSSYNTKAHSFTMASGYNIPLEARVDIVTVSFKNGLLYCSTQNNITLTQDMVFMPVMTPHTVTEVINLLKAL